MATKKAAGNGVRARRGRTGLTRPGCTEAGGAGAGSSGTSAISSAATGVTSAGGPAAAGERKEPLTDRCDRAPEAEADSPAPSDAPEHSRARQGSGCDGEKPPHDGPGHPGDDPQGLPRAPRTPATTPPGALTGAWAAPMLDPETPGPNAVNGPGAPEDPPAD